MDKKTLMKSKLYICAEASQLQHFADEFNDTEYAALEKGCLKEIERHATAILEEVKELNKYYDKF